MCWHCVSFDWSLPIGYQDIVEVIFFCYVLVGLVWSGSLCFVGLNSKQVVEVGGSRTKRCGQSIDCDYRHRLLQLCCRPSGVLMLMLMLILKPLVMLTVDMDTDDDKIRLWYRR